MVSLAFWRRPKPEEERASALSFSDWVSYFNFAGNTYAYGGINQSYPGQRQEAIGSDFASLAAYGYMSNPIVAACMDVRMLLFSEARFQFRQLRSGRPGDLFGSAELAPLERPWPGGTTADLLSRALQDVDLAGNFFAVRRGDNIRRLRPDWMLIILGSYQDSDVVAGDVDAEVVGYVYQPGGPGSGRDPVWLLREEVAHFVWKPDPLASFRGMSWLTPVIREIMSDRAATDTKLAFWENGATPNLLIKFDRQIQQAAFDAWVDKFKAGHEGSANAYKTLFLGGGADATAIGANLEQADFKAVQGAGETRIANAAQVPAVIGGFSEGLEGSSLNAGNYEAAFRRFADLTLRPLWRNIAGSLSTIVPPPPGAELWYDDRDIPALRENVADSAAVQVQQATAMATLTREGWLPDSVVDAVNAGDWKRLKHSGLTSVQVSAPAPSTNGTTVPARAALAVAEQPDTSADKDGDDRG